MSNTTITMREALNQAMAEEMERDETVFLIGEEVAEYNGAYKVSQGLLKRFGPMRVVDTPISENSFTGLAVGAAMVGLRPVVEFMSLNFSLVAFDQVFSNAAKTHYMSGGQFAVPMVMRGPGGPAAQVAAQHSNVLDHCFANAPGLKVVLPSTPADAKGLLKSSIRDNNPVVFVENELLYGVSGEVPGGDYTIPFDPRTIKPLDLETITRSVRKTHRVVIVEEGHRFAGVGAEIADRIYTACFDDLDAPIVRVTQAENPLPYAKNLEAASLPSAEEIVRAAKAVLYRN
jgi:pyruvate dehydrogenase E1 component beta subunit